jgi:hypothetical protein
MACHGKPRRLPRRPTKARRPPPRPRLPQLLQPGTRQDRPECAGPPVRRKVESPAAVPGTRRRPTRQRRPDGNPERKSCDRSAGVADTRTGRCPFTAQLSLEHDNGDTPHTIASRFGAVGGDKPRPALSQPHLPLHAAPKPPGAPAPRCHRHDRADTQPGHWIVLAAATASGSTKIIVKTGSPRVPAVAEAR